MTVGYVRGESLIHVAHGVRIGGCVCILPCTVLCEGVSLLHQSVEYIRRSPYSKSNHECAVTFEVSRIDAQEDKRCFRILGPLRNRSPDFLIFPLGNFTANSWPSHPSKAKVRRYLEWFGTVPYRIDFPPLVLLYACQGDLRMLSDQKTRLLYARAGERGKRVLACSRVAMVRSTVLLDTIMAYPIFFMPLPMRFNSHEYK